MLGMMSDKRKMASLILGDVKPSGETEMGPEVSGCEACAQDILQAIESKDSGALAEALRALVSMVNDENEMTEG